MRLNLSSNRVFFFSTAVLVAVDLLFVGVLIVSNFHPDPFRPKNDLTNGAGFPELQTLKNQSWDFQKLALFWGNIARSKGGEYAYKGLAQAAIEGDMPGNIDLHLLGHVVGDILYKQQGIKGIKVCTQDLRNACSHSIVVGFLLDQGPGSLPEAVATCHEAPGGSGAYTMCVHGLGHGVLAYTDYDMRKAVELCEKIGTAQYNNQEAAQCVGGITMEMMSGIHDPVAWGKQRDNYLKKSDPLAPCDMGFINGDSLNFCYMYLTPHLFEAAGADIGFPDPKYYPKAMGYCGKIADERFRSTCYASFGKEFVVIANDRNVESVVSMSDDQLKKVFDWCSKGPKAALSPCLDSALQSLYWGGENDRAVSIRFCSAIPDKSESSKCMDSLIAAVSYYMGNNAEYKQAFCKDLPADYRDVCHSRLLSYEASE